MADRFNLDVQQQLRKAQVDGLLRLWDDYGKETAELKGELSRAADATECSRIEHKLGRLTKKKQRLKQRLLQFGVKVERRGRPALALEDRADYQRSKMTVYLEDSDLAYLRGLREQRVFDTYSSFFTFLINAFRQMAK